MKIIYLAFFSVFLALNLKATEPVKISYKHSDSSFVKSFYGGSTFTVPEGKNWKINRAFISANDGYNIQISLSNFKNEYKSGEKLNIPYYIAEMELLSKKEMIVYFLYIEETNITK